MKKKKRKLGNALMIALLLMIFFYVFIEQAGTKVKANELVKAYGTNTTESDKKYLNKEIEVRGKVKAYCDLENENNLLELYTDNENLFMYCIILKKDDEQKASTLTRGTEVTIKGKCIGIKSLKFPDSIYIEVFEIK